MDEEKQQWLEREIARELHELPDLQAPSTLLPRVMEAIGRPTAVPWFRLSWTAWPMPMQAASFVSLTMVFAGLCFGVWHLLQTAPVQAGISTLGRWVAGIGAVLQSVAVLGKLLEQMLTGLGHGVLLGGLAAVLLSYGAFLLLAACYYRLGLSTVTSEKNYESL